MNEKLPLYTPTKSLDVNYSFVQGNKERASVVVESKDTHAILNTACNKLFDLKMKKNRLPPTSKVNLEPKPKSKAKPKEKINFATASITLLYTDTSMEEGYLGEDIQKQVFALNLPDKKNRIFSSMDLYTDEYKEPKVTPNKGKRCKIFNHYLTKRVDAFSLISENFHIPIKSKPAINVNDLNYVISNAMFHETYHHTEQDVMHYLSSEAGIKSVVNTALSLKVSYLYGIVLDLYSQRMVCSNCNIGFLGMQNSYANQGFIYDLNGALKRKNIEPRINGKTMLSTRVSVTKPNKTSTLDALRLPEDENVVHEYDANQDNQVFQALGSNLDLAVIKNKKNLSLQSYTGGFFTSSSLSKIRLEKTIALKGNDEPCNFLFNKITL